MKIVDECRRIVDSAHVCFKQSGEHRDWLWSVDLSSFEAIHGISRVVKLVPDKLATAIAINRENLPDPTDDGTFMIVLVIDLLKFYQDLVEQQPLRNSLGDGTSNLDLPENEVKVISDTVQSLTTHSEFQNQKIMSIENVKRSFNFRLVLKKLSEYLESFKAILTEKRDNEFEQSSLSILGMCDDILTSCIVYMNFVHPIILEIKRRGRVEDVLIDQLKTNLTEKLNGNNRKLTKEFLELTTCETK